MIVCCWLPNFALRVTAHRRRRDLSLPLALSEVAATHPLVVDCTAAARAHGVEPGMLISRAMGCCADLVVLDLEQEVVADAAERFIARLERLGAAVQPMQPGRVFFDAAPLERLYGGSDGVFSRVRGSFRSDELRLGAGPNPFVAWVAARHAQPGGWLVVEQEEARAMLAGMPLSLLPVDDRLLELLAALGLTTLGDFASIDRGKVTDRLGARGAWLHELAQGIDARVLQPRVPAEPVETSIQFPEAVANVQTLQRAVRMLVERVVSHPRCVQHAPGAVVVVAWLATGGSWRTRRVLRTPTVDPGRIALTAQVGLEEVPAPVERLAVRLEEFERRVATQQGLLGRRGANLSDQAGGADGAVGADPERLQAGVRHVQAAVGDDALLQVLEVEPWSRMPERHAVLVPRHSDGGGGGGDGRDRAGARGSSVEPLRGVSE